MVIGVGTTAILSYSGREIGFNSNKSSGGGRGDL
jgi:hypothetical protein